MKNDRKTIFLFIFGATFLLSVLSFVESVQTVVLRFIPDIRQLNILPPVWSGRHIFWYCFLAAGLVYLSALFLHWVFPRSIRNVRRLGVMCLLGVWAGLFLLQTLRVEMFLCEILGSNRKRMLSDIIWPFYVRAQYIRQAYPQCRSLQYVTDMDLSHDPGMVTQRIWAYYLYPLDLRGIRGDSKSPDCLFIFQSDNVPLRLPKGYSLELKDRHMGLAVKR
ncbi:MAG: hypothetical protein ACLFPX_02400 [Candidatus Omnitrophota bacterium]